MLSRWRGDWSPLDAWDCRCDMAVLIYLEKEALKIIGSGLSTHHSWNLHVATQTGGVGLEVVS